MNLCWAKAREIPVRAKSEVRLIKTPKGGVSLQAHASLSISPKIQSPKNPSNFPPLQIRKIVKPRSNPKLSCTFLDLIGHSPSYQTSI